MKYRIRTTDSLEDLATFVAPSNELAIAHFMAQGYDPEKLGGPVWLSVWDGLVWRKVRVLLD